MTLEDMKKLLDKGDELLDRVRRELSEIDNKSSTKGKKKSKQNKD